MATMASRLLGVVREVVLAALFGAAGGVEMDAFNVAFRVPNLLRDLFAEGAMTAAFVPVVTRTLARDGRQAAWRLGNLVINALLVVTGAAVLAGLVCAAPLTHAIAPRFADTPGKLELTTGLTRAMLPFLPAVAVSVAMMGMLNSLRRFFVPALAPAMFNVATIACAVAVVPLMPRVGLPPIAGIAIGTVAGGIAQVLLQWPALRREGFRYRPILDVRDPALREVLRMLAPGTLGLAAVQINVFVNTYLATGQPQGAVSWLSYAFRLMYLPIGLFGVSLATAALPEISRHAANHDAPAVRRTLSGALRMLLMLNVPATIGLMVLATPIVSLILERGRFTAFDTAATAAALICYAPGLLAYSAVKMTAPTFYALGDSRTPVLLSLASAGLNLALNLALVRVLGFRGLALGTAVAAIFNAAALLWLLQRRLDGLDGARIGVTFAKVLAASLAMGASAHLTIVWLTGAIAGSSSAVRALRVSIAIAAGLITLAAVARALKLEELSLAAGAIMRRNAAAPPA